MINITIGKSWKDNISNGSISIGISLEFIEDIRMDLKKTINQNKIIAKFFTNQNLGLQKSANEKIFNPNFLSALNSISDNYIIDGEKIIIKLKNNQWQLTKNQNNNMILNFQKKSDQSIKNIYDQLDLQNIQNITDYHSVFSENLITAKLQSSQLNHDINIYYLNNKLLHTNHKFNGINIVFFDKILDINLDNFMIDNYYNGIPDLDTSKLKKICINGLSNNDDLKLFIYQLNFLHFLEKIIGSNLSINKDTIMIPINQYELFFNQQADQLWFGMKSSQNQLISNNHNQQNNNKFFINEVFDKIQSYKSLQEIHSSSFNFLNELTKQNNLIIQLLLWLSIDTNWMLNNIHKNLLGFDFLILINIYNLYQNKEFIGQNINQTLSVMFITKILLGHNKLITGWLCLIMCHDFAGNYGLYRWKINEDQIMDLLKKLYINIEAKINPNDIFQKFSLMENLLHKFYIGGIFYFNKIKILIGINIIQLYFGIINIRMAISYNIISHNFNNDKQLLLKQWAKKKNNILFNSIPQETSNESLSPILSYYNE